MAVNRTSPTYVNMGIEREMLVRLTGSLKAEMIHLRKLVNQGKRVPTSQFIAFLASIGLDVAVSRWASPNLIPSPPPLSGNIRDDVNARMAMELKRHIKAVHDSIYAVLPSPGIGQFIAFLCSLGLDVARATYLPALASQAKKHSPE